MSRSYKKHAVITDYSKTRRKTKRLANKKVRKTKELSNGSNYRKCYNGYNICDYKKHLKREKKIEILSQLEFAYQNNDKQKIWKKLFLYYKK